MNVAGVLGLASESGLNPFARLLVRLGFELSRTASYRETPHPERDLWHYAYLHLFA